MVQINFALKEVNCKIVYYGPGMSGKTTNLEKIHEKTPRTNAGELTSIATEGDRTLFFDFMPLDLGTIAGMKTKFQIYTVPGQVYYNSTRKIVLQGADGVIFVGDSQPDKIEENRESLKNLEENLKEHGLEMGDIPVVIQWNKQDLPGVLSCEELDKELNPWGFVSIPASAYTGDGVFPTLKKMSQLVIAKLNEDHGKKSGLKKAPPKASPAAKPASGSGDDSGAAASATKAKKLSASEILKAKMKEKQAGGELPKSHGPRSRSGTNAPKPKSEAGAAAQPAAQEQAGKPSEATASPAKAAAKAAAEKQAAPTRGSSARVHDRPKPPRAHEPRKSAPARQQGGSAAARSNMPIVVTILVAAIIIAGAVIFALK